LRPAHDAHVRGGTIGQDLGTRHGHGREPFDAQGRAHGDRHADATLLARPEGSDEQRVSIGTAVEAHRLAVPAHLDLQEPGAVLLERQDGEEEPSDHAWPRALAAGPRMEAATTARTPPSTT
jgi:hypothetical protein